MMGMSCRKCRATLTGYIHNELTPRARRKVDLHLNDCHACAAIYMEQKRAAREFETQLRSIGTPNEQRLNQMWAAIQSEIQPAPKRAVSTEWWLPQPNGETVRYGVAAFALVGVLILPTLLTGRPSALALPNPPTPQVSADQTAAADGVQTVVSLSGSAWSMHLPISETAEPALYGADVRESNGLPDASSARQAAQQSIYSQSNYAPTPGATDSP